MLDYLVIGFLIAVGAILAIHLVAWAIAGAALGLAIAGRLGSAWMVAYGILWVVAFPVMLCLAVGGGIWYQMNC